MYDLKHELISVQIKLENAEKELAKMKEENNDLQMQIVKLETEMKNRRKYKNEGAQETAEASSFCLALFLCK